MLQSRLVIKPSSVAVENVGGRNPAPVEVGRLFTRFLLRPNWLFVWDF